MSSLNTQQSISKTNITNINLMNSANNTGEGFHPLYDKWTFYAHLPHDTDWTIDSYKSILSVENVEESIALLESFPDIMIKNCMLFVMRKNIKPIWEDEQNRNGGCFSYKVSNKNISNAWRNLCYTILGETISKNKEFLSCINGATISPKKNFCIIKIWMKDCNHQNVSLLSDIPGLDKHGVIFKKHKPEY